MERGERLIRHRFWHPNESIVEYDCADVNKILSKISVRMEMDELKISHSI